MGAESTGWCVRRPADYARVSVGGVPQIDKLLDTRERRGYSERYIYSNWCPKNTEKRKMYVSPYRKQIRADSGGQRVQGGHEIDHTIGGTFGFWILPMRGEELDRRNGRRYQIVQ